MGKRIRYAVVGLGHIAQVAVLPGFAHARELLGLTDTEAELLPQLQRGWALWKVGQRSFLVSHHLSSLESEIVDTDARMLVSAAA